MFKYFQICIENLWGYQKRLFRERTFCNNVAGINYFSHTERIYTSANICDCYNTQLAFTCSKLTIETLEQRWEICSKLTVKPPKRCQHRFGGVIVNFEPISHLCSSVSIVNFEHVIADWVLDFKKDVLHIRDILRIQFQSVLAKFSGKAIIEVNQYQQVLKR